MGVNWNYIYDARTYEYQTDPSLFARSPPAKSKNPRIIGRPPQPKNYVLVLFSSFYLQKRCYVSCFSPPLQIHEHQAVWPEDLFELSTSFDAPIHRRVSECTFVFGATTRICETDRGRNVTIFEDSPLTEIHFRKIHLEKDYILSISNIK